MADHMYRRDQIRRNSLPEIYSNTEATGWLDIARVGDIEQVSPRC
jgi:hypothetical protein